MKHYNRFGGTTLVITLALLAALAIIGTTMISMARMDRFAARSYRLNTQMDLAADAALEWFGARWAEAYWARETPAYPNGSNTAKPVAQPPLWNSYDIYLPGGGLASRGDSPYDDDSLISLLLPSGASPLVSPVARVGNTSNTYYKITTTAQTTNVPTTSWPISPAGQTDGYIYPELRFPAGPNRNVEVSLTAVDLCARLNVNYTGSLSSLNNATCTAWHGASLQEVTPPNGLAPFATGPANAVIAFAGLSNIVGGSGVLGRCGTVGVGVGAAATAQTELVDGTMNQFAPGIYASGAGSTNAPGVNVAGTHPLPFSLEDLSELLNIPGNTGASSTLGTFMSRLGVHDTIDLSAKTTHPLNRTFVTTHSWTSAARRYYFKAGDAASETVAGLGDLHVKADLNNAPQADLEKALLATRMFNTSNTTDMCVLEQIVANIIDYRREIYKASYPNHSGPAGYAGHPTEVTGKKLNGINTGGVKIYGNQRQPYINEVYMIRNTNAIAPYGAGIDPSKPSNYLYSVYISLANPYDQQLLKTVSFTQITIGAGANMITITPNGPIPMSPGPGQAGGDVIGTVISTPSTLPQTELGIGSYLEPVCLYNKGTDGATIMIDRMQMCFPTDPTQKASQTSMQRPTYAGTYHNGTTNQRFFGGYMEGPNYDQLLTPAMTGLTLNLPGPAGTLKDPAGTFAPAQLATGANANYLVRPIENRGRTWYLGPDTPVRTRACYQPWLTSSGNSSTIPDLSFASPGDLCRLLIIGPQPTTIGGPAASFGYNTSGVLAMTASTVTEQLGAYAPGGAIDECDMHIDLAKISAKTSTGAGAGISAAYDWRRLLDVFNVNSPYYDGLDNSGRGQVVDNQGTNAVLSNSLVAEVGELYEHGRINLLTAPSQVVQAMFAPLAYVAPATGDTLLASVPTWATAIANKRAGVTSGVPWKSPADILDLANAQTIFTAKTCDDDGNGAFKDYAKRCWLYNYISNWATIRSDCCAVYGTVRLNDTSVAGSSQIMGLRHFVAVMDRVPATAYQPIIPSGGLVKPNPNYQPPRRLLLTWLD